MKVVILQEQIRIEDEEWMPFLHRVYRGEVTRADCHMLRSLVIMRDTCIATGYSESPWNAIPLVTARHSVRKRWNAAALRRCCQQQKKPIFICPARDGVKKRPLTVRQLCLLAMRKDDKNDLPNEIELAIGATALVTQNLNTDKDLANGAKGTIVDIGFHVDEPLPSQDDCVVRLQ